MKLDHLSFSSLNDGEQCLAMFHAKRIVPQEQRIPEMPSSPRDRGKLIHKMRQLFLHATARGESTDNVPQLALEQEPQCAAEYEEHAMSQDVMELINAVRDANHERDEARELHAAVCAKYADTIMRLHRISNVIAGYQSAHSKDNVEIGPDKEAVAKNGKYVGTIPATVADEALDTRYRIDMRDAGRGHLLR